MGTKTAKLDIREAKFENLNQIGKIEHLQELIIDKNQFTDQQLKGIPQRIKIIKK